MIRFKFNHFWFLCALFFFCSILYFVWPHKEEVIHFFKTGEGRRGTSIIAVGMVIMIFSIFIYMPYRIITEMFFSYWIANGVLFIKKFGKVKEVPLNKMVLVIRKPLWTRFLGGAYLVFDYAGKRYRIPTGFYLSSQDYERLKQKITIIEQKNFEAEP